MSVVTSVRNSVSVPHPSFESRIFVISFSFEFGYHDIGSYYDFLKYVLDCPRQHTGFETDTGIDIRPDGQ